MRTVDELAPGMTGVWRVTTQGSVHVWDLDAGTYVKRRVRSAQHRSMVGFPQDEPLRIGEVVTWPKVGECFIVFLDHHEWGWHRSSTIRSIEEVGDDADERLS